MTKSNASLTYCGSAHCGRPIHRWLDEGTPYARLSSENCGAMQQRTPEELAQSDVDAKAVIQGILDRIASREHPECCGELMTIGAPTGQTARCEVCLRVEEI